MVTNRRLCFKAAISCFLSSYLMKSLFELALVMAASDLEFCRLLPAAKLGTADDVAPLYEPLPLLLPDNYLECFMDSFVDVGVDVSISGCIKSVLRIISLTASSMLLIWVCAALLKNSEYAYLSSLWMTSTTL